MILNDKLVAQRLASRPEFLLRLHEFTSSYNIGDKPALIAQASPATTAGLVTVDLNDDRLVGRMKAGAGGTDAFWNSFYSPLVPTPTFHGIAMLAARQEPTWALEAHRDGHFLAGVWDFLEAAYDGKSCPAIAHFYSAFFADFLTVISNAVASGIAYEVTATLINAPHLRYVREGDQGGRVTLPPPKITNLQWPILAGSVGTAWNQIGEQMADAMAGAYGAKIRRT